MALSNTAVPKYYGMFRDAVIRGEIPVCREIEMEMNRIDDLIANPGIYYDDQAVEGFISYCENELTLTDGSDLKLLDTFKVWAEQIFGWYYFVERSVYEPYEDGHGGHYVTKSIRKRLVNKQWKYMRIWITILLNAVMMYDALVMTHTMQRNLLNVGQVKMDHSE